MHKSCTLFFVLLAGCAARAPSPRSLALARSLMEQQRQECRGRSLEARSAIRAKLDALEDSMIGASEQESGRILTQEATLVRQLIQLDMTKSCTVPRAR